MTTEPNEYITVAEAVGRWLRKEQKEKELPPVLKDFNPLQLRPKDSARIETPELMQYNFVVALVDVYERRILGKAHKFVDYWLLDDTTDQKQKQVVLRIIPVETQNPEAPTKMNYLLLSLHAAEEPFNETVVTEVLPKGQLEITLPDGTDAVYMRPEGLTEPYIAAVTEYKGNGNPEIPETIKYWDFARELSDKTLAYYFLELNEGTGMMQGFVGEPISEQDVRVLRSRPA